MEFDIQRIAPKFDNIFGNLESTKRRLFKFSSGDLNGNTTIEADADMRLR
jgi:hypothetical protein